MKIVEAFDEQMLDGLLVGGKIGKGEKKVVSYHEKDNKNIKHGTYATGGGCFYNRYGVRDLYQKGDEYYSEGVMGPFNSQEDAEAAMKEYRPTAVKESYRIMKTKKTR